MKIFMVFVFEFLVLFSYIAASPIAENIPASSNDAKGKNLNL